LFATFSVSSYIASAHPYASGIAGTNAPGNGVGIASFILNESADDVTIIFDPGQASSWTNDLGALTGGSGIGLQQFLFPGTNTSYQIIVKKKGSGSPSVISTDTYSNAVWGTPRGLAVNKNAGTGASFGRVYVGNAGANPPHYHGIYAFNADLTDALGKGTNAAGQNSFTGSGTSGPYKMRVNDDGTLLVTDASTPAAALYQFSGDLSTSNLVLAIIGQNAATAAGVHADFFGTPKMFGSLAQGNLVLYTADGDLPAPGDTNCIKGPLTGPGSFNCIYRYNIGAGPIPTSGWSKRPDYAYTLGLDGLALFLNTEVDVGTNGIVYGSFGRANASDPNVQILRPWITTNGITGDLVNRTNQDIASSPTNWLYTSGVYNPPFHVPPTGGTAGDPWTGINGSGNTAGGSFCGIRVSPDYVYLASVDIGNGATIASLTNGVPDESSIFGIAPQNLGSSSTGNSRGMDWDPADNLWIASSGQGLIRCYSLGLTTTCITSNDWTGTNGSFSMSVPAVHASMAVINRDGTQNYTNNVSNAGVAQPAVFRITLNTNDTTGLGQTFVGYARNGTGPANPGIVGVVNVTNGGTNYTTAPTVSFSASGSTYGATAVANISGGKVVSITVTHPGAGYTATPTITFSGGGGGSNAAATAIRGLDIGQYTINTNDTPDGVVITPAGVVFPAGVWPHAGNWSVDVKFTPTQYPVSGPYYPMNVRLLGGTNYSTAAPFSGALGLINTGPQFLQVSGPAPGSLAGMSRGILHDSARFVITRWGDTNGPGNDASAPPTARPLVIPTVNYIAPSGNSNLMAKPNTDFTALAQKYTGAIPTDGAPGITINPGEVTVTSMIGNPILHTNPNQAQSNLTVIINLTNVCDTVGSPGCNTNLTDANGKAYQVNLSAVTLSEFDNSLGGETVLWSNPLTNSFDSTNWTLTFATINQDASPALPLVVSNYDNSATNAQVEYYAWFGKPVNDPANDFGALGSIIVPQSQTMLANNWSNALKVSVNKFPLSAGESGINLYPQLPGAPWNGGSNMLTFNGNYALRFDMFLSLYDFGINYPAIGTPAREFAAFGINHRGTNVNWRLDVNPRADGTGARPINSDGQWCAIDAASGAITPADYDMFISPGMAAFATNGTPIAQPVPYTTANFTLAPFTNAYQFSPGNYSGATNFFGNAGVAADQVSGNNNQFGGAVQNGIIKTPPFVGINANGGAPDNAWVDVSLELRRQTNLTLKVAQQAIFSSSITNGAANNPSGSVLAPLSGTPMLGYLDPNADLSDNSAFVYYSNMRVVELSPYIAWTNQPVAGLIVTQGTTAIITAGAQYGTPPLTNIWYRGTTNASTGNTGPLGNRDVFTMTAAMGVTNVFTNYTVGLNGITNGFGFTNLSVANIQSGTNYMCSWSDSAGGITSYVAVVEVILGPGTKTVNAGTTNTLAVTPSGNHPPTSFQWKRFGTNIVASTHFGGVTAATLGITNIVPSDAGDYSNVVVNADGAVIAVGTLNVNVGPNTAAVVPSSTNRPWGSAVTFTASITNTAFAGGVPTGPLTYHWKRGGVNLTDGGDISGSSSSALTITNLSQSVYGGTGPLNQYTFGVTNSVGGVLSSAGTLNVDLLPHQVTGISVTPTNVVISFVSSNAFDNPSAFTLQSAGDVEGPYTNAPGTIITTGGGFQVTAPYTGAATLFYRLVHSN
jgi:hypothetical protein